MKTPLKTLQNRKRQLEDCLKTTKEQRRVDATRGIVNVFTTKRIQRLERDLKIINNKIAMITGGGGPTAA